MAISQLKSKTKTTGAKLKRKGKKKLYGLGSRPMLTGVAETKNKTVRVKGANTKTKLLSANKVNVVDSKSGKCEMVDLKTIVKNPANRHFVRRNILTKGAVVETPKGKVKITSRPGQDGVVNGVLVA